MTQLAIDFGPAPRRERSGRDLGHAAADSAARHADRVSKDWSDQALEMLRWYSLTHPDVMAEDVRQFATALGLPKPPELRAWGAVMLRGKRAGFIKHAGWTTAKDPRVHSNPVGTWKSLVYVDPITAYFTDRANGAHAAKSP